MTCAVRAQHSTFPVVFLLVSCAGTPVETSEPIHQSVTSEVTLASGTKTRIRTERRPGESAEELVQRHRERVAAVKAGADR